MSPAGAAVDLNADLGEGSAGEAELMALVTSANIACGGHAGDAESMRAAVDAAVAAGVAIGAHPSYEDRAGFGRVEMPLSPPEIRDLIRRQVGALQDIAAGRGVSLAHVKPHGALYNRAARDQALAEAIAVAVHEFDPHLILFGLAGGELMRAGAAQGLKVAHEVFADRTYQADGSLTPRARPDAFVADAAAAAARVLEMVRRGEVRSVDGARVAVRADTVCLHGDGPGGAAFARRLRQALAAEGMALRAIRPSD